MHLHTLHINHHSLLFPYLTERQESQSIEEIFSLYQPYAGVITKQITYFPPGGTLPAYVGHAEYADIDVLVSAMNDGAIVQTPFQKNMFAGGKGLTLSDMTISSLAEGVERIAGALNACAWQPMRGSYEQLTNEGYPCLSPDKIPLLATEQYATENQPYLPFTNNPSLGWVKGIRLFSGQEIWVPAQLVLPFYLPDEDEDRIGYATTGGLACHINKEQALRHGILELIERDAVNLHWVCRKAPRRILIDRIPRHPRLARMIEIIKKLPLELHFLLHETKFNVPVVTVIHLNPAFRKNGYAPGGGVGETLEEAILYALGEYAQAEGTMRLAQLAPEWQLSKATHRLFELPEDAKPKDITTFFKAIPYYGYPSNARKLEWYLQGEEISLSDYEDHFQAPESNSFAQVLETLKAHDLDPITFDLTPPQFKQGRLIKSWIPELTSPYVAARPLWGNPRYYETPSQLGWTEQKLSFAELNKDPQPYP